MSLDSWKAEFYPTPAAKMDELDAAHHSLLKWIGLRKENLDKHDIYASRTSIIDMNDRTSSMLLDGGSCALCKTNIKENGKYTDCDTCILSKIRNGRSCDFRKELEDHAPWQMFIKKGNPEPMIELLQAAIQKLEEERKPKYLSELEAWKYLRDCWIDAKLGEDSIVWKDSKHGRDGLCMTIESMVCVEIINGYIADIMLAHINRVPIQDFAHPRYKWPLNEQGAKMRVAFCNKMIAEIEYQNSLEVSQ